jgi:hypothetical protein
MLGRGRMLGFTSVFEQLRPNTGSFRTQSRELVTYAGLRGSWTGVRPRRHRPQKLPMISPPPLPLDTAAERGTRRARRRAVEQDPRPTWCSNTTDVFRDL